MPLYILVFGLSLLLSTPFRANAATIRAITFPVDGSHSFRDDFHEPRGDGTREHLGIDIISAKMTPILAAVDGTVSYVVSPEASWGYSITIRDSEGYQYRYIHMNNDTPGTDDGAGGELYAYAPGIKRGAQVTKGQVVGWVGDSGNAESVGAHLHFEIRAPDRTNIDPYESLLAADVKNPSPAPVPAPATTTNPTPPPSQTPLQYTFTKALSVGSENEDVRQLQILLKALGYFDYPTATGYFGAVTKAAVIKFQKAQNIDPIGIVGPMTRGVLNSI